MDNNKPKNSVKPVMYGIWNDMKKEWQFGICEPTQRRAYKALFKKIRYDAYKWRFEARKLPAELIKRKVSE